MDAKIDMLHRSDLTGKTPSQTGPRAHKSSESSLRVLESEASKMMIKYLHSE